MFKQHLNFPKQNAPSGKKSWNNTLSISAYKPFRGVDKFYLGVDSLSTPKFLFYDDFKYRYILQIKPHGYTPKTGVLLCKYLTNRVKNKKVLDIGTGETGIIAIHCAVHQAKKVSACDLGKETIIWAKRNSKINNLTNIKWFVSDIFSHIKQNEKFDIIVSNPPQMPMKHGSLHDWGGLDGRLYIKKIISGARKHLLLRGRLILLVFDFLGVVKNYNQKPSLVKVLMGAGFKLPIIASYKRIIRKGGQTEKSINYIKKIYPNFVFKKDKKGRLYHRLFIISAALK